MAVLTERSEIFRKVTCSCQSGSVMVLALMMVVLLGIIGIAANYLASTEVQIAGNERTYQKNFYMAESAALEGIQRIYNASSAPEDGDAGWDWLNPPDTFNPDDPDSVDFDGEDSNDNAAIASADIDPDGKTGFAAEFLSTAPGASLRMTSPHGAIHSYAVFGRHASNSGEALIEIGYKRR